MNSSRVAIIARSKHSYFATVRSYANPWGLNGSKKGAFATAATATVATVHGGKYLEGAL